MIDDDAPDNDPGDARYGLLCPFLNDDPAYAHGVEFGILWAKLRADEPEPFEDIFLADNEEQIRVAASRLGWVVELTEPFGDCGGWVRMRLVPPT